VVIPLSYSHITSANPVPTGADKGKKSLRVKKFASGKPPLDHQLDYRSRERIARN
jgi:hypothetical protein